MCIRDRLIAVSKLFDGITDIFFGSMIDKTHSKLGKARPWMLYGYIGCAITLPLGTYTISEVQAPYGFVHTDHTYTVVLDWDNQYLSLIHI